MSIIDVETGREFIRTTLLGITIANGYSFTIKSANGGLVENPLKTADSLLPRAYVYSDTARLQKGETFGNRRVVVPTTVDIWFLPSGTGNGDEHEVYLDAAIRAITAATLPAGVKVYFAEDECTYGASAGGRAILRIPMMIEATYSLR